MVGKLLIGSVFLPLLLVLSVSGFVLVKSIVANQSDVTSLENQKYTLSAYMGSPSDWITYQNQNLGYTIKNPQDWKAQTNAKRSSNVIDSYEAFLGPKIKLTVTVNKFIQIPKSAKILQLGPNQFSLLEDNGRYKSVAIGKNQLYYLIELEQDDFFENSKQFRNAFNFFLFNFRFSDQVSPSPSPKPSN